MAESTEQRVVIVLADISGYTRFMVDQTSALHGQSCITYLIETLLKEVDIPLQLQEIEGDAIFLYAADPGADAGWQDVLDQVRNKLERFFDVFFAALVLASKATPCDCAICARADTLSLKMVVHSGTALFHSIAGRAQVSGPDVILAHRLLKNSVDSDEYLLMSEAAYRDLGSKMPGDFVEGVERYEGFPAAKTYVRQMKDIRGRHLDAFRNWETDEVRERARGYVQRVALGQFGAFIEQWRRPTIRVPWPKRVGRVLVALLTLPMLLLAGPRAIARRLQAKQREMRDPPTAATASDSAA